MIQILLSLLLQTSGIYSTFIDTYKLTDGQHVIAARVIDGAGNVTISDPVTFFIDNANAIIVTISPMSDNTVTGKVNITVMVKEPEKVSRIELLINGVLKSNKSSSPLTYNWNTSPYKRSVPIITILTSYNTGNSTHKSIPVVVK